MITHFLGQEEVKGYAGDLVKRLIRLGNKFPLVWCPIGNSGMALTHVISKQVGDWVKKVHTAPVSYDKESHRVELDEPQDAKLIAKGGNVFVLDSSIHSGSTMLAVIRKLEKLGAKNVLSYSLVIKQCSTFIPHYFGLLIGDHDRALFLLDDIPNNRLFKPTIQPIGILRRLEYADCARQEKLKTDVDSINRTSLSDLWYQHIAYGHEIYVNEVKGKIISFLVLKFSDSILLIDMVAVDKKFQNAGIGSLMLRWAETMARMKKCTHIQLWGIKEQVHLYKHFKYEVISPAIDLHGEKYYKMERRLPYNFDLTEMK